MSIDSRLRPTYEASSSLVWGVTATVMLVSAIFVADFGLPLLYGVGIALFFCAIRSAQTYREWMRKVPLYGNPLTFVHILKLYHSTKANPDYTWVGWGFDFTAKHTQALIDMLQVDVASLLPPKWFMRLIGRGDAVDAMHTLRGLPWIHGISDTEADIFIPTSSLNGHFLMVGGPGTGKTVNMGLQAVQMIFRREPLIIFDPKNSPTLQNMIKAALRVDGREQDFLNFHPAKPEESVRLNLLKNWNVPTEVTTRVNALAAEQEMNSFTAFSWMSINRVVHGLIYIDQRPTLLEIKHHLQDGCDTLTEKVLERYLQRHVQRWSALVDNEVRKIKGDPMHGSKQLLGMVQVYKNEGRRIFRDDIVEGLVSQYEHNRDHYSRMIVQVLPGLEMVTTGKLGQLLSPDTYDVNDHRPIVDITQIIEQNKVLYLNLNALPDPITAMAISTLAFADMAAAIGNLYNFADQKYKVVNVLGDEAAELVCMPLIQNLNKGREAGVRIGVGTQTISDFITKMGSSAAAHMLLGNINTVFGHRTIDTESQKYLSERFGEVFIKQLSEGKNINMSTKDSISDYQSGAGSSMSQKDSSLVPAHIIGKVRDLEYFGLLMGGRASKIRLPILQYSP